MAYPIFRAKHHKSGRSSWIEFVKVARFHGHIPEFRGEYVRVALIPEMKPARSPSDACAEDVLETLDLTLTRVLNPSGREETILSVPDGYEIPEHHLLTKVEADA